MRKSIVSGIIAASVAIAPVAATAAEAPPASLSPAVESANGSELRGDLANTVARIVAAIGVLLVAYIVARALVDDDETVSP